MSIRIQNKIVIPNFCNVRTQVLKMIFKITTSSFHVIKKDSLEFFPIQPFRNKHLIHFPRCCNNVFTSFHAIFNTIIFCYNQTYYYYYYYYFCYIHILRTMSYLTLEVITLYACKCCDSKCLSSLEICPNSDFLFW